MEGAVLTILRDGEELKEHEVKDEAWLGRSQDCGIRIDDRAISRKHLVIRPVENGLQVEKKSKFGNLNVNGTDCTSAILREGDHFSIGPFEVKVSVGAQLVARSSAHAIQAPAGEFEQLEGTRAEPLPLEQQPAPMTNLPEPGPVTNFPPLDASVDSPASGVEEAQPDFAGEGLEKPEDLVRIEGPSRPILAPGAAPGPMHETQPEPESLAPGLEEFPPPTGDEAPEAPSPEPDAFGEEAPGAEAELDSSAVEGGLDLDAAALAPPSADNAPMPMDTGTALEIGGDESTRVLEPAKLRVLLVFPPGTADVTEFEITKEQVVVGRSKTCDVTINDKKSSRRHIIIRRSGMDFSIKDLGSVNGTFVNGVRIDEQELSGEDSIRIGDTVFQFKALSADYEKNQDQFLSIPDEPEEIVQDPAQGLPDGMPSPLAPDAGDQAMSGENPPGFTGVGLPAVGNVDTQPGGKAPQTLLEKFRALPKRKQIIYGAVGILLLWTLLEEDPGPAPQQRKPATAKKNKKGKTGRTFTQLSAEQKRFVESQYQLSFDLYTNKEYDKSLFEIRKIFQLINEYKDSRDIERYAKEGKRRLEALEEEKRRKEEEARLRAKVAQLTSEAQEFINEEKFDEASKIFPEILALDPENGLVAKWQARIDQIAESKRQKELEKKVQKQINDLGRDLFAKAVKLVEEEKFFESIKAFEAIPGRGVTDKALLKKIANSIEETKIRMAGKVSPLLDEGKLKEEASAYADAFKLYEQVIKIDPRNQIAIDGMDRIRGVLHQRAKVAYTAAVLAESYSDFEIAREKFREILSFAPKDDEYYGKAQRKLNRYTPFRSPAADEGESQ